MEQIEAFRHAVTWSEPFIIGLIAFQVVVLVLSLYVTRPSVTLVPRVTMLIFIGVLVRSAEYVNEWAAREWETFCTQNYFDRGGVFISIFLCAPLLIDSFLMLILFLREAAQLLVQVKKAELTKKRKDAKRRSKKDQ
jgi:TRAP-type uncharacterized transport system fused permease subunit